MLAPWRVSVRICARALAAALLSTLCDDAALHTGKVMSLRPEVQDVAAQVLYERALLLAESPPGIDWNGVDVLTEKHFEAGGAGGAGATE